MRYLAGLFSNFSIFNICVMCLNLCGSVQIIALVETDQCIL